MAITLSSGHPTITAVTIPSPIYSTKVDEKFYKATVFSEIANTNWQG